MPIIAEADFQDVGPKSKIYRAFTIETGRDKVGVAYLVFKHTYLNGEVRHKFVEAFRNRKAAYKLYEKIVRKAQGMYNEPEYVD